MDTNEKTAVKIVRDCLTTAHESLPAYASCLYVASMPIIKAHGVDDATTRHMTVDDGYFRYVTVDGKRVGDVVKFKPDWGGSYVFNEEWHDGKRGVQIKARTLADLKRKIADHYQN